MVNSILVPTPALLALGGRPGGIPRAASQHQCAEHVGGRL